VRVFTMDSAVLGLGSSGLRVLVRCAFSQQKFTLEDAIGSHASSLEAAMRVTNAIPLGSPLPLTVVTVNCVATLKADVPNLLSALCLNARGLTSLIESNALENIAAVFYSPKYLSHFGQNTAVMLGKVSAAFFSPWILLC
jgi:hypothetical protein